MSLIITHINSSNRDAYCDSAGPCGSSRKFNFLGEKDTFSSVIRHRSLTNGTTAIKSFGRNDNNLNKKNDTMIRSAPCRHSPPACGATTASTALAVAVSTRMRRTKTQPRSRPNRQKMASIGVEAMRMMNSSSSAPCSDGFSNTPVAVSVNSLSQKQQKLHLHHRQCCVPMKKANEACLSVPLSENPLPSLSFSDLPTTKKERQHQDHNNRKHYGNNKNNNRIKNKILLHGMGKRLRQIKRRLFLELASSSSNYDSSICKSNPKNWNLSDSSKTENTFLLTLSSSSFSSMMEEEETELQPIIKDNNDCVDNGTRPSSSLTTTKTVLAPIISTFEEVLAFSTSLDDNDLQEDDEDDWGMFVPFL